MWEAGETGGDASCDILGRNMVVAMAGRRWTTLTWTTLDDVGRRWTLDEFKWNGLRNRGDLY